ncbi:hypothetical protein HS7_08230 [Sulfolobales archaeon HS-7]|nr:hypothetical protein HS7_08230 [Sulfolobales archaeon HS-7]
MIEVEGDGIAFSVDMVKELVSLTKGQEVIVSLTKSKPEFTERDFCARGYVFHERNVNGRFVTLISLFGLLVKVNSSEGLLQKGVFAMLDHVYLCIKVK